MRNESGRVSRIINELNTYFLDKDPTKLNICVDNLEDHFKISFEVCDVEYSDEEVKEMLEILNEERQPSIESYYWTLTGESSVDSELSLIGMMIDKAEISFKDSCLLMYLYRSK